jgi:hypothetical protein
MEAPNETKPKTESDEPRRDIPMMDIELPKRAKLRKDKALPIDMNS